jgi:peroxiredoxin
LLVVTFIAGITALAVVSSSNDESRSGRCPTHLPPDGEPLAIGDRMPNFTLPDLDGNCVSTAQFRGQPLIVNFWASYCRPCRIEFPLFEEARERYANNDLEVLGIDYQDIASDGKAFAEEKGADWPLFFDGDGDVAKLFDVGPSIPQTYFIARDGTVVSHVFGLTSPRDLNAEIARIVKD